jgi:hypothetical protein
MQPFEFDIQIPAATQEDALRKANAAAVLLQKLSVAELEKLAYIVNNDPKKLAMARSFLGLK